MIDNTGHYTCTVVAAMVALSMQNRIVKNDIWGMYNAIYYGTGGANGGVFLSTLASYLNSYYKMYYASDRHKCYVKEKNVRFIDIKNAVDSDYKSLLSVWPKSGSGHTVPVLGYYSYFFKKDYCVDYIMIATDWHDTEEKYFDSVYLNEFPRESHFMYVK